MKSDKSLALDDVELRRRQVEATVKAVEGVTQAISWWKREKRVAIIVALSSLIFTLLIFSTIGIVIYKSVSKGESLGDVFVDGNSIGRNWNCVADDGRMNATVKDLLQASWLSDVWKDLKCYPVQKNKSKSGG